MKVVASLYNSEHPFCKINNIKSCKIIRSNKPDDKYAGNLISTDFKNANSFLNSYRS